MKCDDLVNELVRHGMTARYVTDQTYSKNIMTMTKNTVLIYMHSEGQDVILMGDNLIDVVRFKFRTGRRNIRE